MYLSASEAQTLVLSAALRLRLTPAPRTHKDTNTQRQYTLMVMIFGHRGAPGYPRQGENTIASFKKALQCGANGVEFDVRRCADGQLVVIHDETIDRTTTGRGRVADLTYDELRQFDAGFGEPVRAGA